MKPFVDLLSGVLLKKTLEIVHRRSSVYGAFRPYSA